MCVISRPLFYFISFRLVSSRSILFHLVSSYFISIHLASSRFILLQFLTNIPCILHETSWNSYTLRIKVYTLWYLLELIVLSSLLRVWGDLRYLYYFLFYQICINKLFCIFYVRVPVGFIFHPYNRDNRVPLRY